MMLLLPEYKGFFETGGFRSLVKESKMLLNCWNDQFLECL